MRGHRPTNKYPTRHAQLSLQGSGEVGGGGEERRGRGSGEDLTGNKDDAASIQFVDGARSGANIFDFPG